MSEDGAPPTGQSESISAIYRDFAAATALRATLDRQLANTPEGTDEWEQAWSSLEAATIRIEDLIASLADQPGASNADLVLKAKALAAVLASTRDGMTDLAEGRVRLALSVASDVIRLL